VKKPSSSARGTIDVRGGIERRGTTEDASAAGGEVGVGGEAEGRDGDGAAMDGFVATPEA
jgi:hypothetical protein